MESYETLKLYFSGYMINIRGRSETTAKHYLDALNNISKHLKEAGLVQNSIYEITDLEDLYEARDYLLATDKFIEQNRRGNQMYSAGLNNYIRFAEGEEFEGVIDADYSLLDSVIPVQQRKEEIISTWKRSNIIRQQTLQMAGYKCEIDSDHETFIVANTTHRYMEGHHAIPLQRQSLFPNCSLDVYANIVCLCPLCHRKAHFAENEVKKKILSIIYYHRGERLAKSGIKLSKDEFQELVLNGLA